MFKKLISYTDFNGKQQTEAHYFNMSKTELTSLEINKDGGFSNHIMEIVECQNDKNNKKLAGLIKELILMSYGVKSEDGKRFKKSEELSAEFEQTAAFDEFYISLLTNTDELLEFLKGIMPVMTKEQEKQIDTEVNKLMEQRANVTN